MITNERLEDLAQNKKLNYLCTEIMELAQELLDLRTKYARTKKRYGDLIKDIDDVLALHEDEI